MKQSKFNDVYKSFNEYRLRRAESRKAFSIKQQHKFVKAIERIAKEYSSNEEQTAKPMDILLDFGKTVSSEFTKAYVLDSKSMRAHEEGYIYIHDLDYFNLGMLHSMHLKITNDIMFPDEWINLCLNIKEEIDGEISICSIDKRLTEWLIKKYKEIFKQKLNDYLGVVGFINYINMPKVEKLIDNQNTILLNMNLFEQFILNKQVENIFNKAYEDTLKVLSTTTTDSILKFLLCLNDNHKENRKYSISLGTDNSYEGKYISDKLIEILNNTKPLKNVATIFKLKKVLDEDLLCKVSELIENGKNISLNFVDATYNKDENEVEYFENGKRIFENVNSNEKSSVGRMIVATSSINLSRLGFKYNNIKDLYAELDEKLEIIKNQLLLSFENIGNKSKENYRFLFQDNVLDDGQKIRKIIKNGVINIGIVGLKECVINLNECDFSLAIDILKHINKICEKYTNETKLNFVLSETSKNKPLRELMALDKTIYGIHKGITDKEYYSRIDSFFEYKNDLLDDLNKMGNVQKLLNGGNKFEIKIPPKTTIKKITEMIKMMNDSNVGFVKIYKEFNYDN